MNQNQYDVIIIGCGVAGMTAALYLKRSGIKTLIVEGATPGGQVVKTSTITNYPGFKSITGAELVTKILSQLQELKVDILYKKATQIHLDQELKTVVFSDQSKMSAKNVIIATGRVPKKLNLEKEDQLLGKGISYCATCDGVLYKDKNVAVIGGGDSALEEAIYLSSLCKKVTIIHRREELKAKSYLQEELKYIDNIELLRNTQVLSFLEQENKLIGLQLKKEGQIASLSVDGCFIFIGYQPEIENFSDLGIADSEGYIVTNENMETSCKGIYAVGDIRKKEVKQIVTATNDGAIAAIHILKNIE